jgi:beta-glucosidase/6-phospho-beta-glucosidase/beta-galactosidase
MKSGGVSSWVGKRLIFLMDKNYPQFKSFLMGGFECAAPRQEDHIRIDSLTHTRHDLLCREDYKLLKGIGIKTVREGFQWSMIDKGNGKYDFERFEKMVAAGKEEDIEQIWDLNHFDYPDYLDPFSDEFINTFSEYAKKCAELLKKYEHGQIYIVPINEISFFSFMAASVGLWAPYLRSAGYRFKQQLVKASIKAMDAIWEIDKNIRFIQIDPIFYRVAKSPFTIVTKAMEEAFRETKYQTFDMLTGRLLPELGGQEKYVDIIGANYYMYNQEWITGDDLMDASCHVQIPLDNSERIPLKVLLKDLHDRYRRPIFLAETGCIGGLRVQWWKNLFKEVDDAIASGLPILGICAYPVIDRPDWHDLHLTNSGFWDFKEGNKDLERVPHRELLEIIKEYINKRN